MEINMILAIDECEERLLKQLGVPWNGWQYERAEFDEMNSELEANGITVYASFTEYLEARIEYKRKIA
jgi:hypothetical protein